MRVVFKDASGRSVFLSCSDFAQALTLAYSIYWRGLPFFERVEQACIESVDFMEWFDL